MQTPPMAFATRTGVENQQKQPGNALPVAEGKVLHKPISALNPYQAKWTIKVKVDAKQPLKSSTIKGELTSILSVVLVDNEVGPAHFAECRLESFNCRFLCYKVPKCWNTV